MKTFSYADVTANAESLIRRYMREARAAGDDDDENRLMSWAYGVYASWMFLTAAFQKEGDETRLEALTKPHHELED